MKIGIVTPTLGGSSGVGRFSEELSSLLRERGVEVEVISTQNTPHLKVKGLMNLSWAAFSQLKHLRDLSIVHSMNPLGCFAAWRINRPRVLTLHGVFSSQLGLLWGGAVGMLSRFLERKALEWADVVVAVSKAAQRHYVSRGFKVHHVPNAVNLKKFPEGSERIFKKQVIFVGRLSREKNPQAALKIASLQKDVGVVVVGDGPEKRRLQTALGARNVSFLGAQPWERTIRLIRGSDVLLLPSLQEGLPTVLLEALALRTAIVAYEVGGIKEAITHNVNGLLAPMSDEAALSEAVARVLCDSKLRERLAEAGAERVRREFSWEVAIEKYLNIYRSL